MKCSWILRDENWYGPKARSQRKMAIKAIVSIMVMMIAVMMTMIKYLMTMTMVTMTITICYLVI